MKTCFVRTGHAFCFLATVGFAAGMLGHGPQVLAQGALTPPGAPAATMKTLEQVEPRRPISALPFTIAAPGSYYLTTNLVNTSGLNGLQIQSPNVTLDLNGFSIIGNTGALAGIAINVISTNLVIRNGSVSGWGGAGVSASSRHGRLEKVHALYNGGDGISVSDFWSVIGCQARANGDDGIVTASSGLVEDCVSMGNAGDGIQVGTGGIVRNSRVGTNAGDGMVLSSGAIVESCTIHNSGRNGIRNSGEGHHRVLRSTVQRSALHGIDLNNCCNVVTDNLITLSGYDGIRVLNDSMVARNNVHASGQTTNAGAGIRVVDTRNRVEDNLVSANDNGIATGTFGNSLIIRNQANDNNTNYVILGTQNVGPILNATGAMTNLSPWANFSN